MIRIHALDDRPFWVDEAESSINALTILEKGVPTDSYLGLPIYENTLIEHWPSNPEYEFRDLSYSDKHLAIYHGWLPLYAIAASFAVQGIAADQDDGSRFIKHDIRERKRRTRAARLPSVLMGTLFLIIAFAGASLFYGRDAGWAALMVGTIYPYHVTISRQARYYSAQVTLTTACCVSIWYLLKSCSWRSICLTATTLTLLFYTHLLGFCTAGLILVLSAPLIVRRDSAGVRKLVVLFGLVAIGTLPWVFATGFYKQQSRIPRAWTLLKLPGDLWRFPPVQWDVALLGSLVALATLSLVLTKYPVSERILAPTRHLSPVLLFLGLWTVGGYALFIAFIPAVSFDANRLNLSYWGPAFLLASAACAAMARLVSPKRSIVLAPAILLAICLCLGRQTNYFQSPTRDFWAADSELFTYLGAAHLNSETKIYASPNDHLILTFYSGLPIQDITPVRKSYLDTYRGEIVYIDRAISVDTGVLDPECIMKAARQHGYRMSTDDARDLSTQLRTIDYRRTMLSTLYPAGLSQLERLSTLDRELLAAQHRRLDSFFSDSSLELVTRGYVVKSWSDWRVLLKYRFIEPKAHSGGLANYAARLRDADALILVKADTAVYRSHWHAFYGGVPLTFKFVQ